jgi:class 3 adenylate cyclase
MEAEVLYCTSADGTLIAYTVLGDGPPLVQCPGAFESFLDLPTEWDAYDLVGCGRTTVKYDFRGVGFSQRDANSFTLDRMVEDLEAVVDAAQLDRFVLLGTALGSPVAIQYAARHPARVSRLVLLRAITESSDLMPQENMEAIVTLIRSNWEMGSQMLADMGNRADHPGAAARLAESYRRGASADAVASMLTDLYATGHVRDVLKDIAMPALILHRREETVCPFSAAVHAASAIPKARLVPLPGSGPPSLGPDGEANMRIVAAFLDEDAETRALPSNDATALRSGSAFRAVLFTDLVGHTEMMSRLGDERGREVLREHERITREVLAANGGTEVKTMGDGFMASFGSVTKAVECAIALQRAMDEWNATERAQQAAPLRVRVGLNAGEPIEEDGPDGRSDLFGATVILASRIAAKAEGGEILVADTVRGLCSGKGFLFADRGEFVAKGFEEPVRVYEVSWGE